MATSNFLQWNNAAINQEDDAEYLVDSQRVGGAPVTGIAPSKTMNKFYYQVSTFVAAFGAMMAAKGFSVSDADIGVLQAVLANISTSADFRPLITTLGYSPTPNFAANTADGFQFPLNGNVTSSTISGQTPGQAIAFYLSQDATGGRTIVWPTNFFGMTQPDPTPNAMSLFLVRVDNGGNVHAVTTSTSSDDLTTFNNVLIAAATIQGIADIATLKLAGAAPNGFALVGDGTSYVPTAIVSQSGQVAVPSHTFGAGNESQLFTFALGSAVGATDVCAASIDADPGPNCGAWIWASGSTLFVKLYNGSGGGGGGGVTTNSFNVNYKIMP